MLKLVVYEVVLLVVYEVVLLVVYEVVLLGDPVDSCFMRFEDNVVE